MLLFIHLTSFVNIIIMCFPTIIPPSQVSHTSDHFAVCEELARKMIREGKGYMDDTDQETMQVCCIVECSSVYVV